MTTKPLSRRSKAMTLVPLALLSGVWTASLVSSSATANSAAGMTALPDGTTVPEDAIEAPASVPVPGVIAPAVPEGSADSVVSGASSNGIPAAALAAYQRGAQIIDAADKSCNIPWELIAAIGRVESDHGRYGGNTLTEDGISKPGIYGIALNGKNGTQAINDTDGGQLDKDPVFDRAVGPMQFIPSTWQVVKVDADGDAKRNPQDMDDAALATAVYLCSGKDNLSIRKGQEAAVYRYNHSQDYVNLVLRIMEAYSSGDYTAVPSGTQAGTTFSPSYSSSIDKSYKVAKQRKAREAKARANGTRGSGSGGTGGSGGSGGGVDNNGSLPGNGTPPAGGGGGNGAVDASGDPIKKVVDDVKGTVGTVTNPPSTPTPTKTPAPPVLTKTEQCLKSIGLPTNTNPGSLGLVLKNLFDKCMKA
jgi:membrane-bound lytic murein transglycosylase B